MLNQLFIYLLCSIVVLINPLAVYAEVLSSSSLKTANTATQFITRKLAMGEKPNRLIHEKSPYLLQHAFNPIDWYPWGEEAFAKARKEGKPIFLSIGYSTCHWCHVMAHESFEDEAVAAFLNKYFVCIKVDREERPDVDQLYMAVVQAMTGGGGWPMSLFLTPDLKPFYAGTYFPPESRFGMPGFSNLLESVHQAWLDNNEKILQSADKIIDHIEETTKATSTGKLNEEIFNKAFQQIAKEFDATHGGFGRQPKFPRPVLFNFLLRYFKRTNDKHALEITLVTLRKMVAGGMYDHLGGGFHRYSVDGQWRVPHFEKMLYDQGQLVPAYLEAFQITHDPFFANVARDILDYISRDMTSPEGGFFSAEDADSTDKDNSEKHGEGLFYIWGEQEIINALGKETAEIFNYHYGVKPKGNALEDPQGEFTNKNILYVAHTLKETAKRFDKSSKEISNLLDSAQQKLFNQRQTRPRPHLDDKIITSWNGYMISAFARSYQVLNEEKYLKAAEGAAKFIMSTLYDPKNKTLLRRFRDGEAGLEAHLDDYVFLVNGLLDLYEASFDIEWLQHAVHLTEKQIELFEDTKNGGFYDTSGLDKSVLIQMKSDYDGAEPTGNSIAALNFLRLAQMTDNSSWHEKAVNTINAFSRQIEGYPPIMPQMLVAYDFQSQKPKQIVIAGEPDAADTKKMLAEIRKKFLPNKIVLLADGGEGQKWLAQYLPFFKDIGTQKEKATAYVCQNYTCKLPTTDITEMSKLLEN